MIGFTGGDKSGGGKVFSKKIPVIGGASVALGAIVLAGAVLSMDLRRFVPDLGARLSHQSGQRVEINGPLRVRLGRDAALWLSLSDVAIRPAGAQAWSASMGEVRVKVAIKPLLRREISPEVMEIRGGRFVVERGLSLHDAFEDLPKKSELAAPEDQWRIGAVRRLRINRSFVGVVDKGEDVFSFPISNFTVEPDDGGLALNLNGKIEDRAVVFEGSSGPWEALLGGKRVYLDGTITSASARLELSGSVGDPSVHGIEFLAHGSADDLADVAILAGYGDLKHTSSMDVALHVKATTDTLVVRDLELKYGRGDVSGYFDIRRGEKIAVDGRLTSQFLDLAAFEGGHLLHPPKKIFSNRKLPVDFIRKLEGDVRLTAKTIILANARLTDGQISIIASNGVVAMNPIAVTYDEGFVDSTLVLYGRDVPGFKGTVSLVNFDIGRLLTAAGVTRPFTARLHAGAHLAGTGQTIADMFAAAQGQTNLVMGAGRLGPQITELFGGRDVAGLTPVDAKASGQDVIELTCLVSRFDVADGIARSSALLVQTKDSVTTGRGAVNLKSETIDLRLAPRPYNPAFLKQAADLRISGALAAPAYSVDRKKISKGIAGSLGRFARTERDEERLLPMIDAEVTDNNPCIVALTGKRVTPEGRSRIYSLTQVR